MTLKQLFDHPEVRSDLEVRRIEWKFNLERAAVVGRIFPNSVFLISHNFISDTCCDNDYKNYIQRFNNLQSWLYMIHLKGRT